MAIVVDRKEFFERVRSVFGALNQQQVDGFNEILDGMEKDTTLVSVRYAAYMLATAWHETDKTMEPITEYGKGRGRKYGKPGRNRGQIAYGRGYVQLTWDTNYERADKELGLDGALIRNYELALKPEIAYRIMSRGMTEGWFTGKKLSDYIRGHVANYLSARRIINGTDKAVLIAGYARQFESVLKASEKKSLRAD